MEPSHIDPAVEIEQRARLAELRATRDAERTANLLEFLGQSARSSGNLLPVFIDCVENQITLGEICGVLRKIWGEYQAPNFL